MSSSGFRYHNVSSKLSDEEKETLRIEHSNTHIEIDCELPTSPLRIRLNDIRKTLYAHIKAIEEELFHLQARAKEAEIETDKVIKQRDVIAKELETAAKLYRINEIKTNYISKLEAACQMALDWHQADTEQFVAKYGHGIGSRDLCECLRRAFDQQPKAFHLHKLSCTVKTIRVQTTGFPPGTLSDPMEINCICDVLGKIDE